MSKYTVTPTQFSPLAGSHKGTGTYEDAKNLVEPLSVDQDIKKPLDFRFIKFSITVMSFEIATGEAPNWYGVGFRNGIRSFDTVNIFCHPSPGYAGMTDQDYPTRSNSWSKIFRYVDMLASQVAVANSDQILIIPFFNNATYVSTGIFGPNWQDIVEQIRHTVIAQVQLGAVATKVQVPPNAGPFAAARAAFEAAISPDVVHPINYTASLKNVVLSDFSYGRTFMWNIRKSAWPGELSAQSLGLCGNGDAAPYTKKDVRGILYDQSRSIPPDRRRFHMPPERWVPYHQKVVENVHGDIPALLGWHAARISSFGKSA